VNKPEKLPQRVRFEADGTVSIATGKVELGQGIATALAPIRMKNGMESPSNRDL